MSDADCTAGHEPRSIAASFSSVFTDDGEEGDSADNSTEENSSIFSVIWMC